MFRKKQKNDNPLHTEYGILKNILYILQKIKYYNPFLLVLIGVSALTDTLMQCMWSFIGKFVIDLVQPMTEANQSLRALIRLLLVIMLAELVIMVLHNLASNRMWYSFIVVRMRIITERVEKALSMNYQMLEQPKILDMHQKALEATGGNDNGVEGLMHSFYTVCVQVLLLIVTVTAVTALDVRMLLIMAVISTLQYLFFRYTVKKDRREVWDKLAPTWRKINYMEQVTQDFGYAKDIRLFNMKEYLSGKQHQALRQKQDKMLYSRNLWIYNSEFAHLMSMISMAVVYGILIYNVIDQDMSIGNFTLYLGLATTFTSALTQFFNTMGECKDRSMQVDDFRSFMDLRTEEEEGLLPVPDSPKYTFTFKNVSFRYQGAENYALKNLNLTLEPGMRLAIVGLNGAGKSTFVKLLLRLYDVTEGEILLNGINIQKFRREEYFKLFAPVFQNVELFAFPLSENVSMRTPEETDEERAGECLRQAGMEEKLAELKDGVRTQILKVIHQDGIDLSGGERQKLALSRALYKDAPILVLDEPTAALDALAEYRLYKSFDDIIADKTAVYISHRLSSTRFCNKIAMFQGGELAEYGTHEELMQRKGAYAKLFEVQAQYYRDKEAGIDDGKEACI